MRKIIGLFIICLLLVSCQTEKHYKVVTKNGTVHYINATNYIVFCGNVSFTDGKGYVKDVDYIEVIE